MAVQEAPFFLLPVDLGTVCKMPKHCVFLFKRYLESMSSSRPQKTDFLSKVQINVGFSFDARPCKTHICTICFCQWESLYWAAGPQRHRLCAHFRFTLRRRRTRRGGGRGFKHAPASVQTSKLLRTSDAYIIC